MALPASRNVPATLGGCSSTEAKLLLSPWVSAKPKSARVSVRLVSWPVVTLLLAPTGASLTDSTEVEVTTVAALNAVAPPKLLASTVAPELTATELSTSRTDRLLGVPL